MIRGPGLFKQLSFPRNLIRSPTLALPGKINKQSAASGGGGAPATWTTVKKTADETVNNSATVQDDNHVLFAVSASKNYAWRAVLFMDTNATADFKITFTGPASPTLVRFGTGIIASAGSVGSTAPATAFGTELAVVGAQTNNIVIIEGVLQNGANAGTVQLQWAQNTATVVDTIVRAGSYLEHMTI